MAIKRTKYFDQQLLVVSDFTTEQAYHVEMRRRHNRLLHTSGVVSGLEVSKHITQKRTLLITKGHAIDKEGKEIELEADTPLDLSDTSKYPSQGTVYITISHTEGDSDDKSDEYASDPSKRIRIKETSQVAASTTAPDSAAVPLATVKLAPGDIDNIDNTVRKASAFSNAEADLAVRSIALAVPSLPPENWPKLSAARTAMSQRNVILSGSLSINGALTAVNIGLTGGLTTKGNVGVGIDAPTQKLEVSGNAVIGNSFIGDVGYGADWAGFCHKDAVGQSSYAVLQHKSGTETLINKKLGGKWISFRVDNQDKMTIVDSGYVGIGTTEPKQTLDVRGETYTQVLRITNSSGTPYRDTAINMADNIEGNKPFLHIGGITDKDGQRRIALYADRTIVSGSLEVRGALNVLGAKTGYVADKFINCLNEQVEEGDVVVISNSQGGIYYGQHGNIPIPEIDLAQKVYDTTVCGIVCEVHAKYDANPEANKNKQAETEAIAATFQSLTPEELKSQGRTLVKPHQVGLMVTLGAYAHCKVDANIAPINIGDLLTTSPTKGHAQKVLNRTKAVGAIIGKALGALEKGQGKIPVMVILQ